MKTAISVPSKLFEAAEKLARRLGVSRSRLFTNAVSEYLRQHGGADITEKLNQLYESEPASLDALSQALQSVSLGKDETTGNGGKEEVSAIKR